MPSTSTDPGRETVERTMHLIHRAKVATAERINADLADLELNGTLALLLETLYEHGPMTAAELARRCLVTRQALTGPLNQLQARGLVQRPESATNVRTRPTALTEDGKALTKIVRRRVRRAERLSVSGFDINELETLRELLARYASAWEQLAHAAETGRSVINPVAS